MGLVQIGNSTGDKKYLTVCYVLQQAANTVTADYSAVADAKSYSYILGSNEAAAARTITERNDVRLKSLVFAGLSVAGTGVAATTTTTGSQTITSAAAFSLSQMQGCAVTGAGVPADTYIVQVTDTSTATMSKPATASASVTITLWDRIILSFFH